MDGSHEDEIWRRKVEYESEYHSYNNEADDNEYGDEHKGEDVVDVDDDGTSSTAGGAEIEGRSAGLGE